MKYLLLLIFTIQSALAISQDKIVMMNGKTKTGTVSEVGELRIYYKIDKGDKQKEKHVDVDRVFSIQYKDSTEEFIYQQDPLLDNDFTIEQVRMYINGDMEAQQNYSAKEVTIGGFLIGTASGLLLGHFYGPIGPIIYTFSVGSFSTSRHKMIVTNEALLYDDQFIQGYQKGARGIKIKNALIGGGVGLVFGIATGFIYHTAVN